MRYNLREYNQYLHIRIMEKDLNKIIVNTILQSIPPKIKPVAYLMDILGLGRESVYRRIRGEIPFTIDEIAKLSLKLDFSIDEVIGNSKKERIFFDSFSNLSTQSPDAFLVMLQDYYAYLLTKTSAQNSYSDVALNHIPIIFFVYNDNLFKFAYFKWLHQNYPDSIKCQYSDMVVPPEIVEIQKKIEIESVKIDKATIILDPNVYLNLAKDLEYYYQRKLISNEELESIKKDVLAYIDFVEMQAKTGSMADGGTKIDYYLSSLYINISSFFMDCDNTQEAQFWAFPINPVFVRYPEVCSLQKKWFDTIKKHSILITRSNEILQSEYFRKQREYIENIKADNINNYLFI